jgi:hypothetical protein
MNPVPVPFRRHHSLPALTLLCAIAGCSHPTAPAPPTPALVSYAGTWTGQFQLSPTSSVALCGIGWRPLGDIDNVELTLAGSNGAMTGNLSVSLKCETYWDGVPYRTSSVESAVPVTGTVDSMGNLTLAGESAHRPPGFCGRGSETFTKLDRWNSTPVNGGQRLAGSFVFTAYHWLSSCYYGTSTVVGDLISVSRSAN